jgi:uncharacterized protein YqeY
MSLEEKIEQDFKQALKAKQAEKVSVLRMLKSAFKNKAIEEKKTALDDELAMLVLQKELKKHKDSIEAFQLAGREDLAKKESQEAGVLEVYLPARLPEVEVQKIVEEVVASGLADFGPVMKETMARTKGLADGKLVQSLVKAKLGL